MKRINEFYLCRDILMQLRGYTLEALKLLAPRCPHDPGRKTRRWDKDNGGPKGLVFHYTGGPDGIASLRWSNENPANQLSSWHFTVLDSRMVELNDLRAEYPLVEQYFPADIFLHAQLDGATWHANWANRYCFGVENRNFGKLRKRPDGVIGRPSGRRFYPVAPERQYKDPEGGLWEKFTWQQVLTNIHLGRLLHEVYCLDPSWVIPHSLVWASKSDIGQAFPLYFAREAIFRDDLSLDAIEGEYSWLKVHHPSVVDIEKKGNGRAWTGYDDDRSDIVMRHLTYGNTYDIAAVAEYDEKQGIRWRGNLPFVRDCLSALGAHIDYEEVMGDNSLDVCTKVATHIFQRSMKGALKDDGIPGPKTIKLLKQRLKQLGL